MERYGNPDNFVVGFQLTHSGRFCRPEDQGPQPRVAYRHPLLDRKFNVVSDEQVKGTRYELRTSALPTGAYMVKVITGEGTTSRVLNVQR